MTLGCRLPVCVAIGMLIAQTAASAQSLEIRRYNPSE
jgi:hypothetical protein